MSWLSTAASISMAVGPPLVSLYLFLPRLNDMNDFRSTPTKHSPLFANGMISTLLACAQSYIVRDRDATGFSRDVCAIL